MYTFLYSILPSILCKSFNLITRKESELSLFDFDELCIYCSLNQNKRHVFFIRVYTAIKTVKHPLLKKVSFYISE